MRANLDPCQPTAIIMVGSEPGVQRIPRSNVLASSWVRQIPTRSPIEACVQGLRNCCMLLTFLTTCCAGSSTSSLTLMVPLRQVPVTMVPWPLIEKQWSTAYRNGPSTSRLGSAVRAYIESGEAEGWFFWVFFWWGGGERPKRPGKAQKVVVVIVVSFEKHRKWWWWWWW